MHGASYNKHLLQCLPYRPDAQAGVSTNTVVAAVQK